jgi:glutaredoxin 3
MAKQFVDDAIKDNKVAVFSKTFCPYCTMAKSALNDTGAKYFLAELDTPEYREFSC